MAEKKIIQKGGPLLRCRLHSTARTEVPQTPHPTEPHPQPSTDQDRESQSRKQQCAQRRSVKERWMIPPIKQLLSGLFCFCFCAAGLSLRVRSIFVGDNAVLSTIKIKVPFASKFFFIVARHGAFFPLLLNIFSSFCECQPFVWIFVARTATAVSESTIQADSNGFGGGVNSTRN